jgi:Kelch motif
MTCDTTPRGGFATIVTPKAVYLVDGIPVDAPTPLSTTMMIGRAADGSLDPATCTLTSGVTVPVAEYAMGVATVASSVYLIGGNTTGFTTTQNAVYRAEIANGSLTPFSVATLSGGVTPVVLQTSSYGAEIVQVQNYVYVIGGWSSVGETAIASIERAQVDLATGNFVTNFVPAIDPKTGNPATMAVPRFDTVAVHLGSWIYVLGGQVRVSGLHVGGPACQNEIQRASLDATGNLSSFSQVGTLPSGLCAAASYVSCNTLYVLGGVTDIDDNTAAFTSTDAVLTAAIAADGTLGDFTASSVKLSYPVGAAEAVIGKTVYLLEGWKGGTGATTSIEAVTFP